MNPPGVLNLQGVGNSGSLSTGSFSFACTSPTSFKGNAIRTFNETLTFQNSEVTSFEAKLNVTCTFTNTDPPVFATAPTLQKLTSGQFLSMTLPSVIENSNAPATITFYAPTDLASNVKYVAANRTVAFDGRMTSATTKAFTVSYILTDTAGNPSPTVF